MMDDSTFEPPPIPPELLPPEEWYEVYIRIGLYFGAAFQLVCILALIFLPPVKKKGPHGETLSEEEDFWDEVRVLAL